MVSDKLVRPAISSTAKVHYGKSFVTLERWVSEQGKVVVELKADMAIIKESLPDIKEIKKMLQEIKKNKKLSEGGNSFVDDEDKGRKIST